MSNRRLLKCLLIVTGALCLWHTFGFGDWTYSFFYTPRTFSQRYPDAKPFSYKSHKRINSHNTELNETELAALVEISKILPLNNKKRPAPAQNTSEHQTTVPSWLFYQISSQGDKWVYNRTNVLDFRKQLQNINLNSRRNLVLSNATTRIGDKLRCYFCKANDTVKVLPWFTQAMTKDSPFESKLFKRCSVVGNSGILLNSTCGAEIDQADYVFRCNIAPIGKFVSDAGRQTNLTTLNPSLIRSKYSLLGSKNLTYQFNSDLSEYSGLVLATCLGDPSWIKTCQRAIVRFQSERAKLVMGDPGHFRKVWDFWRNRGLKQVLSTGFYLTSTALELCDEVHLFGFWPFHYTFVSPDPVRYHYFDKVKPKAETHSMAAEFWELWKMHQQGIVQLHITPCNDRNMLLGEEQILKEWLP